MPYSEEVLKFLRRKKYAPSTAESLADSLSVAAEERAAFYAGLDALERAGKVARIKQSLYTLPSRAGLVVGSLDVARAGFGFVVPMDKDRHRHDIHVSQRDMGSATDGDIVAVRLIGKKGRFGQPSGKIEYVIQRHRVNFVGTFEADSRSAKVMVDGSSAIREIIVSRFETPEPQNGDKVVVEVESWNRAGSPPSGAVVEVLGRADDPTTDTVAVTREFALPEEFGEDVLAEAEAVGDSIRPEDIKGRLDLRDRTIITIDPVHARDFDDAISIKRTADGWLLAVHIADVSEYAKPGSALDAEASRRATSVYLPTRVIPMIPHTISNGIASLREGEDRLTKTVILRYNRAGQLLGRELHKSVIRSSKRMTYEQASAVMAGKEPEGITLTDDIRKLFAETAELARLLEQRRVKDGMLELNMPEVDIEIGQGGEVERIVPVSHDASHKLIEMFMVAANEAVAEFMTQRGLPHIRRVHNGPSAEDLQALKVFLSGMGLVVRDTSDRHQLQAILDRSQDRAEAPIINLAVLKSMQRAEYSTELKGHYALASAHYLHYTSPIRRYADLIVHQILDEYLTGRFDDERKAFWRARTGQVAVTCSELSRRAESAERELTKLKILRYLDKHGEGEFEGIVTGVKPFGIFVELSGYVVDGFTHVSELPGGPWRHDARTRRLVSSKRGFSIRLGDGVVVTIQSIDLAARRLDLSFLRKNTPSREDERKKKPKKTKRNR